MSNQPEIDRLTIKVATIEANEANWEQRWMDAQLDGNLVGAREAYNEMRAASNELFEAKRELRQLQLGY